MQLCLLVDPFTPFIHTLSLPFPDLLVLPNNTTGPTSYTASRLSFNAHDVAHSGSEMLDELSPIDQETPHDFHLMRPHGRGV